MEFFSFTDLLARFSNDHDRMHRGGLGESPDGLRAYRRNRRILSAVGFVLAALLLAWWWWI